MATNLYTAPITISATTTLNFIAVDAVGNIYGPQTEYYTIPAEIACDSVESVIVTDSTVAEALVTVAIIDSATGASFESAIQSASAALIDVSTTLDSVDATKSSGTTHSTAILDTITTVDFSTGIVAFVSSLTELGILLDITNISHLAIHTSASYEAATIGETVIGSYQTSSASLWSATGVDNTSSVMAKIASTFEPVTGQDSHVVIASFSCSLDDLVAASSTSDSVAQLVASIQELISLEDYTQNGITITFSVLPDCTLSIALRLETITHTPTIETISVSGLIELITVGG
jgi:hypothetical protein